MILSQEQQRQYAEAWNEVLTHECERLHIERFAKVQAYGICQVAFWIGIQVGRCYQRVEDLCERRAG